MKIDKKLEETVNDDFNYIFTYRAVFGKKDSPDSIALAHEIAVSVPQMDNKHDDMCCMQKAINEIENRMKSCLPFQQGNSENFESQVYMKHISPEQMLSILKMLPEGSKNGDYFVYVYDKATYYSDNEKDTL